MTVDRIFKCVLAYAAIYLIFDILLYLVSPGWSLWTLCIIAALGILATYLWAAFQSTTSYPSTIRAKLREGYNRGAAKP